MNKPRTLPCPRCGNEMKEGAPRCPSCGADFRPRKQTNVWLIVVLIVVGLPILALGTCIALFWR